MNVIVDTRINDNQYVYVGVPSDFFSFSNTERFWSASVQKIVPNSKRRQLVTIIFIELEAIIVLGILIDYHLSLIHI